MATRLTQLTPYSRYSCRPALLGNVFQELEQMLQPMNAAGVNAGGVGTYHPIDLYETDDAVVLEMAVPGIKEENLEISIEGRQLTIRGRSEDEVEKSDRRYWLKGISFGEFSRTVTVPSGIDASTIDANIEEGVLTVTMPKAPEALARKIAVNSTKAEAKRIPTKKEPVGV
ncbi:MAG TPA: Hsp20/alpha crystallin family protein [Trueperaceae bacterium]|nr:Hsp20/alpha crystallin family protein [Trueperaceae bacterium]